MGARGFTLFLWTLVVGLCLGFFITCSHGLVACSSSSSRTDTNRLGNQSSLQENFAGNQLHNYTNDIQISEIHSVEEVQIQINLVYAKYGAEFGSPQIQEWANRLPNYRRVPGRSLNDAERLFTTADRILVERLAARRLEIKEAFDRSNSKNYFDSIQNDDGKSRSKNRNKNLINEIDEY